MRDTSFAVAPIARLADGSIDYVCYDRRARRLRAAAYRRVVAAGAGSATLALFGPTWTLASGPAGGTAR